MMRFAGAVLAGVLAVLAGCSADDPMNGYTPYYQSGTQPFSRAPSGAPLVLAPSSLPTTTGAPLALAPFTVPGDSTAPLPPPVAMEPLAPLPGSSRDSQVPPSSTPDIANLNAGPTTPYPLDPVSPPLASLPTVVSPATPTAVSGPPPLATPDAAAAPTIDQQLAAIKESLAHPSPPRPVRPAHERYGGLSSAGDVPP